MKPGPDDQVRAPSAPRIRRAIGLTKSQVDRAGATVRRGLTSNEIFSQDWEEAAKIVAAYRAAHSYPLTKVSVGLRQFAVTEGLPGVQPAQRLKKLSSIASKLERFSGMRLTQMQDVGGCRLVLPNHQAVQHIRDRIERNWSVVDRDDYMAAPKPSGYRAVHLMVERDARILEIQLRTRGQHRWALVVEVYQDVLGHELKEGRGPDALVEYFRVAADVVAERENARVVREILLERLEDARSAAAPYLESWRIPE